MQGKNRFNNSKYQLWFILFMRHLLHKFHKHKHSIHCIILWFERPLNSNNLLFCTQNCHGLCFNNKSREFQTSKCMQSHSTKAFA